MHSVVICVTVIKQRTSSRKFTISVQINVILLLSGKRNVLGDSNSKSISLVCFLNFALQWEPV